MTRIDPLSSGKCKAHNQRGEPCGARALRGQRVCHYHGGKSPQALASADERMRLLVHPAIAALARLIEKDEFPAARYVLDWAGFRPTDEPSSTDTTPVHVTVVFDRADQNPDPPALALDA